MFLPDKSSLAMGWNTELYKIQAPLFRPDDGIKTFVTVFVLVLKVAKMMFGGGKNIYFQTFLWA